MKRQHPRRNKLIQPRLQLWLVSSFVGLAGVGLLMQFLLLGYRLTSRSSEIAGLSGEVVDEVPSVLLETLLFSLVVVVPLIFAIGILVTFRIAGPIHRFETYLQSVIRGEQVDPCKIRTGDRLQPLCDLINQATEPVRRGAKERTEGEPVAAESSEEARLAG